ncbi:MAG: redoxin domain-containing protein [Verrucomicrobiales bacterium]|nr:redoxin domain-containing protein [Verrucomicrobiales bacterium]
MKTIHAILVLGFSVILSARADAAIADSLNGKLVTAQGKRFAAYDAKQLAETKYFAIYFSAHWCPPCREFTPKLVEFYNRLKPRHPEFELIFMSRDNSENAMRDYMTGDQMPWPAVKFNRVADIKKLGQYAGKGIPCLVFINADGEVLSDSYVDGKYAGPNKVLRDIEATLK